MTYFDHCKTIEEIKLEYKRLASIHHPDKGGTLEIMQEINVEYAAYTNPAPRQARKYPKAERKSAYSQNTYKRVWDDLYSKPRSEGQQKPYSSFVKRMDEQMIKTCAAFGLPQDDSLGITTICHIKAYNISIYCMFNFREIHAVFNDKVDIQAMAILEQLGYKFDMHGWQARYGSKPLYWWSPEYSSPNK